MAKLAADLAVQLAGLPAEGLSRDLQPLDDLEQLATRILKEASAARSASIRSIGETSGRWRPMMPARP